MAQRYFEETVAEFKAVTGLTSNEIINKVQSIRCSYDDALTFYKRYNRFPNNSEDSVIFHMGIRSIII